MDDVLGQERLGGQRSGEGGAGEAPADQFGIFHDVVEVVGVENEEIFDF